MPSTITKVVFEALRKFPLRPLLRHLNASGAPATIGIEQKPHAFGHIFFDRLDADAQPVSDLLLGESLDPAHQERGPAKLGNLLQRPLQVAQLFPGIEGMFGRWLLCRQTEVFKVPQRNHRHNPGVTRQVQRDGDCCLRRILAGIAHAPHIVQPSKAGIHFLHDIVYVEIVGAPRQPGTDRTFMGQHVAPAIAPGRWIVVSSVNNSPKKRTWQDREHALLPNERADVGFFRREVSL